MIEIKTTLKIKIKDIEIEISLDEAKELRKQLANIADEPQKVVTEIIKVREVERPRMWWEYPYYTSSDTYKWNGGNIIYQTPEVIS